MKYLRETEEHIILENNYVTCTISRKEGKITSIFANGIDILGDKTYFFHLIDNNDKIIIPEVLELDENIITVVTKVGSYRVKAEIYDEYFTFELMTHLPECKSGVFAHAKYNYDYANKDNVGACGIAMTFWMNPIFYPDSKSCETKGEVLPHLRDLGAKYALIVAPINKQQDTIKKVSMSIDRSVGIVSEVGGAWGRDSRMNFGNYIIQMETKKEFLEQSMDFYKYIGVDQIDFHQWEGTMRQGDFKFDRYNSPLEFKENVVDLLDANGLSAGLHTYSFYIRYDCDTILSEPDYQKDLGVLETFTLAEDISEQSEFLPTVESTEDVCSLYTFMTRNTPFILVGEELIQFENHTQGFKVVSRGCAGTKVVSHKAGEKIKHIDGYYGGIAPIPGSNLFLQIARNTAKTFNEGGFSMIYLDALDGISVHVAENEKWYYTAMFVCEILKNCNKYPLIEYSILYPSIWAARGRVGAYDTPWRSYKEWNKKHTADNITYIDRYSAPTLGWYNFYPMTDRFPGNEHTKYQHTDDIEHMGSLAIMYDFGTVFQIYEGAADIERYAGMRRNIALYKKYDELRKSQYFSSEVLEKLRNGQWEYHLIEKKDGKYSFIEKDFQKVKLFDLSDKNRNKGKFNNPFDSQEPFIRIEAMMSSAGENPMVLLTMDENCDITNQKLTRDFGEEVDISDRLAKCVRVLGNGIKGSAIAIKTRCATNSEKGFGEYIIDTDFAGWRDFVLLEADNGERPDLPFDKNERFYAVYRSGLNNDRLTSVEIETVGDVSGVRISNITACRHVYEVLKNPTLEIGDSSIMFECELMSSDFIEYDGEKAKVIDRYGNEKNIWYSGSVNVPAGCFEAKLTAKALNRTVPRAQLTLGFTGKEVEV